MKLIYEGFETQQLSDSIDESPTKKLIQELNFKYGLKVVHKLDADPRMYNPLDKFLMVDTNGLAVANIWTQKEDNYDIYCYRSPFYRKDRGSDSADRETIHSKKLSTLMATLKRNNVVPPSDGMINKFPAESFCQGMNFMESHHGSDYKSSNFSAEQIHLMLKAILLRESPSELDLNKCKEVLDKWDKQDRIKVEKRKDVERFFFNEFYAVGADKLKHLVIGSVKAMPRQGHDNYKFEVIKPFKRVTEVPDELKAILTMNKVYYEGKGLDMFYSNIIPATSSYNSDLDVINVATRQVDYFNLQWTLVPCSGI
jgi:hypothetical protein